MRRAAKEAKRVEGGAKAAIRTDSDVESHSSYIISSLISKEREVRGKQLYTTEDVSKGKPATETWVTRLHEWAA